MRILPKLGARTRDTSADITNELIRTEAKIGGALFGPVSPGGRRDFFCLDKHTWIWHEEWKDERGKRQVLTTRYDVRPGGILKSQYGQPYQRLSAQETKHFCQSVELYRRRVGAEYQRLLQTA